MGVRSIWKGPFVDFRVLQKANLALETGARAAIKIRARSCTIIPLFVGLTFGVYNGKKYIPVLVNERMIGRKFGEFSPTRVFNGHSGNKKGSK